MKILTMLALTLMVLVMMPSWICGEESFNQMERQLQPLEESEDDEPSHVQGFLDDYFDKNDTSCVIINGDSLTSEHCHEQVENAIPIAFREMWNSKVGVDRVDLPAELVVIKDGGIYCNSTVECTSQIQSLRKRAMSKGCDLRENFYVGGDGHLYEARGWNLASYWHMNGLHKKSITVQFLGSYGKTPPSPEAIEAFETAMEIGLWQGKLSKTYRVTSMKQLHMDSTVSEDLLSQNPFGLDRWCRGEELSSSWEYTVPRRLRFVFRRHWNASKPTKEFGVISQPVDYVIISEGGDHCYSRSECISKIRALQANYIENYGDLLENFYIADGGEVYEGRGWHATPHWHLKGITNRYISVHLFGSYGNELPNQDIINSLKLLVQTGVRLGKISSGYQMFSLRQVYNQSILLGDSLHEYVRRWSIWSEDTFSNFSSAILPVLTRTEWNAMPSTKSFSKISHPIKYIMIGDGGSQCFSVEQCSSKMQLEQTQHIAKRGDLLDNFYIGDDGIIYEGRGMDALPFFHTPFFNQSLITVKFLGSFQDNLPSQLGWLAFLTLLDMGIVSGKISSDYKIYSFRHIYNDSSLLGNKISHLFEEMRTWDGQLMLASEDQLMTSGILPIYHLEGLNSTKRPKELSPLSLPVEYIVVSDTGEHCFTQEYCRESLRERKATETQLFGGLAYNFYVGEDGSVFTGQGWNSTCHWHITGVKANTLFFMFSGSFQNTLPSQYAMLGFNRLLKFGVRTGKLLTDYKVISVRQLFPNSTHAGDMLAKNIMTWDRWSQYKALSPGGTIVPFGSSAFVPRTEWSRRGVLQVNSEELSSPVSHVIILDADESCFNLEDCILRVQVEQRRVYPQFGDAMENFYIGEDGRIYEGQGWTQETQWHSRIINFDFVTVAFLGHFATQLPSSKAFTAFEYWTKEGVMGGKLTANYSVLSLQQFIPIIQIPGDALNKYIRALENWSNNISQTSVLLDNCRIYTPRDWGNSLSIRQVNKIVRPVKYVYLREGGHPCSSKSECIMQMKAAEKENNSITENFYIGGTGAIFEGIGWEYDTKWGYDKWKYSLSVCFLGTFGSQLPTSQALAALDCLCQEGIKLGHIASDYKILFIPDNYQSKIWVGAKFKELIKSWSRWISRA
ncbi:uncharacterized protein [Hetaerina americana]|uniref:uncharacterized protein n=1 Tax=Hetaerina americana TaxID=62018 RepID=UPI003A7F59B8